MSLSVIVLFLIKLIGCKYGLLIGKFRVFVRITLENSPEFVINTIGVLATIFIIQQHKKVSMSNNPNWPSKTGNSSGGGRGNNPPKSK